MSLTVGFAGLGRMGEPMAAWIAGHGFPLAVWNRTPGRTGQLAAFLASAVSSPFLSYKRDAYLSRYRARIGHHRADGALTAGRRPPSSRPGVRGDDRLTLRGRPGEDSPGRPVSRRS